MQCLAVRGWSLAGTWLLGRGAAASPWPTSKNECLGAIHFNSSLTSLIKWTKVKFPSTPLWPLTFTTTLQLSRRSQIFCTRKLLKWIGKKVKIEEKARTWFPEGFLPSWQRRVWNDLVDLMGETLGLRWLRDATLF